MSLEPRLRILREGGLLSDSNYQHVQNIIQYFQEKRGIELGEANAAVFVTHLCAALRRISQGETINEIDADVYSGVTSEPVFAKALAISQDIQALCPCIPDVEGKFLVLHVCTLLMKEERAS
jgi:transcriptional regulatory protein LevR